MHGSWLCVEWYRNDGHKITERGNSSFPLMGDFIIPCFFIDGGFLAFLSHPLRPVCRDGHCVLASSLDKKIRLLDRKTGELLNDTKALISQLNKCLCPQILCGDKIIHLQTLILTGYNCAFPEKQMHIKCLPYICVLFLPMWPQYYTNH